jgi:hypothetical protein
LEQYRKRYGFTIYAYVLMSNHVHLLIETGKTPLSKIMQGLQFSYTDILTVATERLAICFRVVIERSFNYGSQLWGLDSKHNTFIKTVMLNDERETCIDARPGARCGWNSIGFNSVQALGFTEEPTPY